MNNLRKLIFNIKNNKRNTKIEQDIQLGYRCKSCKEVIRDKTRWGKPTLCQGCEDAIKYGISWH